MCANMLPSRSSLIIMLAKNTGLGQPFCYRVMSVFGAKDRIELLLYSFFGAETDGFVLLFFWAIFLSFSFALGNLSCSSLEDH